MFYALVLPIVSKQFQVLRTIVSWIMVLMMNHFFAAQMPPYHRFHHETMLSYVAVSVAVWVVRAKTQPVAALMQATSATPTAVFLSAIPSGQEIAQPPIVFSPARH